jgi:hypothetical protein
MLSNETTQLPLASKYACFIASRYFNQICAGVEKRSCSMCDGCVCCLLMCVLCVCMCVYVVRVCVLCVCVCVLFVCVSVVCMYVCMRAVCMYVCVLCVCACVCARVCVCNNL